MQIRRDEFNTGLVEAQESEQCESGCSYTNGALYSAGLHRGSVGPRLAAAVETFYIGGDDCGGNDKGEQCKA